MRHFPESARSRRGWAGEALPLVPVIFFTLVLSACTRTQPSAHGPVISAVAVTVNPGGPVTIATKTAEFEISSSGYIAARLVKDGKKLTLDDPETGALAVGDAKEMGSYIMDTAHAKPIAPRIIANSPGKGISIAGLLLGPILPWLERTMTVEVYDDFPNLALVTVAYKNVGPSPHRLSRIVTQRHRLNASLADPKAAPYSMWSFHGASFDWGRDEITEINKGFSRSNVMGAISSSGAGGGVPVVAFWTRSVGVAIGHAEPRPLVLSIPTSVSKDGRVELSLALNPDITLQPGDTYTTPVTFFDVFAGDYYEPLRTYSQLLQRRGWGPAQPNPSDFSANWCGWGYRSDVTPAQMLGTIPKLKELGFRWATLDYRWFNNFGDWEPRPETFTRESIKKVVDEYHRQGIKLQLWWLPLAVSDGQSWEAIGPEEKTPAARQQQKNPAAVIKQHPDWLILDRNGKPSRLFLNRAGLCPALPEVQDYYRMLTEKFIHDWDFDGHKLDMCFTVPACFNPRHHHKSSEDSIGAMGDVFKIIFETTRRLKPDSVTQICPCGTVPNIAWLPYMDQAVTADPVGAVQVRRRIKMYKALLGPEAAVYGDHVELSAMHRVGTEYVESGTDFASTVGTGGVLGTKFTWPDYGPEFKLVYLTPAKEAHWKKWIDLYNAKMLSRGTFRDLYTLGYDIPEGYAIARDGKMYYAFFAPDRTKVWQGTVDLRGLEPGRYRVTDYAEGRDLGTVSAPDAKLATEFIDHLLLEVVRI